MLRSFFNFRKNLKKYFPLLFIYSFISLPTLSNSKFNQFTHLKEYSKKVTIGIETPGSNMVLNFVENTLPEYIDMYLEDTQENTFKKITDGFEINFDEAYEGLGRFYLHFTDQLIPELPTDDNLRIYKGTDSDVMVMGAVGKNYSAKVYDYSGRLIKEVNFNHKTKINDLDSKMKILRIESEEGLTIKKFKLN